MSNNKQYAGFFLVFIVLFFSGFYFTGFESSSFSSVLRVFIIVGFLFLFYNKSLLKDICFSDNYALYIGLVLFFLYVMVLSFYFLEWSFFRRLLIVFLFLITIALYVTKLNFNFNLVIYGLGFIGFVIGVLYIYNYLLINDFSFVRYRQDTLKGTAFESIASYDHTITAALHLCFLSIAAVWGFFNSKNRLVSCFYYITFFMLALVVLGTFARVGLVSISIALIVFFLCEIKRNKIKVLFFHGFVFLLVIFYLNYINIDDVFRGLNSRDVIWIGLLENISGVKNWLFGMGPVASVSFIDMDGVIAVHAHNIYIETLYRNGIVGLFLFVTLLFLAVKNLISKIEFKDNIFFIAVLAAASVAMCFDFYNLIYSPNLIWLWIWFPVGVSLAVRKLN